MIDLKAKPFYLNDDQIAWVNETLEGMTDGEKAEQLFCPMLPFTDLNAIRGMMEGRGYGAVMFRPCPAKETQAAANLLQEISKIPMLIAANFEDGGSGIMPEGTYMGRQMLIAATDDEEKAYQLGKICGTEGAAVGANWAFAPVLDIDMNFHNPITNVRTYGSDHTRSIRMGRSYIKGLTEGGLIPSIKHFPGDGVDERDQHLVTSVNTLSIEEWEETFGKVYRAMIEDGAMTAMVGHIAMPAMEEKFDKKPCERVIPATVSKNIMTNYLRGELGFNGLITTDATPMVGMTAGTVRREAVPAAIENGADVFLFTKDLDEDVRYMKEGIADGRLSRERLNEAVTRILAVKAALGLPEKKADKSIFKTEADLAVVGNADHIAWAKECADLGVTLVKDTQGLLPLDAGKHRRVLFELLGNFPSNDRVRKHFLSLLEREGFSVTEYVPETPENIFNESQVEKFKEKYDLVFYVGNIENASNNTVARISWHTLFGAGNNIPWFVREVPTIFVSVGNPYHLLDVPMVPTFVNGYCHSPYVIDAVVEKLMGRSEFKGKSPVDPFCGRWDTKL